jgi:hypothetical protein
LEPKSNKYRLFRDLYEYTPILEGNNSSVSFLLLNIYRGLKPDTRKQLFFKQNLELLSVAKSKPLREQFVSFLYREGEETKEYEGDISLTNNHANQLCGPIKNCYVFDYNPDISAFTANFPIIYQVDAQSVGIDPTALSKSDKSTIKLVSFDNALVKSSNITSETKDLLTVLLKKHKKHLNK